MEKDIDGIVVGEVNLDFVHYPAVDDNYYMPESIGSGGAFLDYDNDGDLDIYLVNGAIHDNKRMNRPPLKNQLYFQESNGIFLNVIDFSGLGDQGYGIGVTVGDIDNNGVLICW